MAERIHAIVKDSAPALSPKTWYGMPALPRREGRVLLHTCVEVRGEVRDVRPDAEANLDEGAMWPTSFLR